MLEDVQALLSNLESQVQGTEDEALALQASQQELEMLIQQMTDLELARSMRNAEGSDYLAALTVAASDVRVARDHISLYQESDMRVRTPADLSPLLVRLESIAASVSSKLPVRAPPSDDASTRLKGFLQETETRYEKVECVSCEEQQPLHDVFITQCEHAYCKVCIVELVEHTVRDEELYPMRCCKSNLPLERLQKWISPELLKLFREKCIEYESIDRVYCADPGCSKFITGDNVDKATKVATCLTCSKTTCTLCNKASHGDQECPEDSSVTLLFETAKANEWKRCYSCHAMIGISTGCNHMK